MKSNKVIFCPFADPPEDGEKEMQRRKDHRQNQKRERNKKRIRVTEAPTNTSK
jgi:hypothetical protein